MSIAAGELAIVMESYFVSWGLTASEQDVASFTIKGYSISEVSSLRNCAEGTVKTHLNAIYRKSGTNGRAQLVSLLIEDLLRGPLAENTKPAV
jgi:DNA-binding CsgD family transcriptional regulator